LESRITTEKRINNIYKAKNHVSWIIDKYNFYHNQKRLCKKPTCKPEFVEDPIAATMSPPRVSSGTTCKYKRILKVVTGIQDSNI